MIDRIANEVAIQCMDCGIITDIRQFKDILVMALNNYTVSPKEKAIAVYDDLSKGYQMFFVTKKVKGLSDKSLKYHKCVIDDAMIRINKPLDRITADDIRYLLACKKRDGRSNTTLNNIRRVLCSFFKFLVNDDYIVKDPMLNIDVVRQEKVVKKPFSPIELEKILDVCRNDKNELARRRNVAMIECFLSTGCRVGEISSIKIEDVDFRKGECIVHGKGNKERKVFFNDRSILRLSEYIDYRKDNCEYLFCSIKKPFQRLNVGGVETNIRNIGEKAGVTNCHPHRFRRTMACNALKKGMPIEQIQALLGHENIETTKVYLCIDTDKLAVEHNRYLG